jgi:hypothetical protein
MNEKELIENWRDQKLSHNFWQLRAGRIVEFEFLGQYGHPSSYGYVKFDAQPHHRLVVEFDVEWPAEFGATYTKRIINSIGEGVVDGLCVTEMPRRGCRLRLIAFKWDAVGGSEVAVYKTTQKAMQRLVSEGEWELVTGRYRDYGDDESRSHLRALRQYVKDQEKS